MNDCKNNCVDKDCWRFLVHLVSMYGSLFHLISVKFVCLIM
jgi:hypothetical protein